ncbi:MAG: RagB/SusD family nutrient uptake outer membrane protein [Bacteroidales bacterium]
MKKYVPILFVVFLLAGCMENLLDKKPAYEADLDGAITNAKTAELALVGVYSNLPMAEYHTIYTTAPGSFKAGTMRRPEWWTRGNAIYYYERYWPTLQGSSDYDWDADYELIKNANFLMNALKGINDFEGNRKEEMVGELHFLRAFAYNRLMLRYAQYWDIDSKLGLIIRNELPNLDNVKKRRSTVVESYRAILEDLNIAIDKCPNYSSCGRASKVAAKAIKTRVYLQMGKYLECIKMAEEVLKHVDNGLASDYATVFSDYSDTNEILFARMNGTSDDMTSRKNAYSSGKWGPSQNYINFLGNDPRFNAIIGDEVVVDYRYATDGVEYKNHTVKKLVNTSNDLPIIYLRMAEIYLLKAEAIYRSGGSSNDAYAPIATLRNRAGATPVSHATSEEIERAILNEWLIEMSFENWHEYFALQRFGVDKLLERNDILREALEEAAAAGSEAEEQYRMRIDNYRILPIPSGEINANSIVQNPGYN